MKLPNFGSPSSDSSSKIGRHFSNKVILKLMLSKNVNNQECTPELVYFNEKNMRKIQILFDI